MSAGCGDSLGLPGQVRILRDEAELASTAAEWIVGLCKGSAAFHVALAGGSTPRRLYERLADPSCQTKVEWSRWHVWFGDERAVPAYDEASNYQMANTSLLQHVAIPARQIHRMPADDPYLDDAAHRYEAELRAGVQPSRGMPRLELVLLGLGDDGHTASLFPGDGATRVTDRACTPSRAAQEPKDRLTLTFPALNAAARVAFLVTGRHKADALRGVTAARVPAARVRPTDGELVWFLDQAAADSMAQRD